MSKLEWSVADIQQAIKLLTQLALRTDERTDARMAQLEEAQTVSEQKLATLASAQTRTEEALVRLSTAIEALVAAQARPSEGVD